MMLAKLDYLLTAAVLLAACGVGVTLESKPKIGRQSNR